MPSPFALPPPPGQSLGDALTADPALANLYQYDAANGLGVQQAQQAQAAKVRTLGQALAAIPTGVAQSAWSAFTLPGDVYAGRTPMLAGDNPDIIPQATNLAGLMTLGAGAMPAAPDELGMGIRAYHGSPYDFNAFDSSKIGTGEGAQAYGHGLYFAENPKVAQEYKNKSYMGATIDGVPINPETSDTHYWVDRGWRASSGGNPDAATSFLQTRVKSDMDYKAIDEAIGLIESGRSKPMIGGKTYEVDINANPDEFLNWDKPLSQQPKPVQDALSGFGYFGDGRTMAQGYAKLAQDYGRDGSVMAAGKLRDLGIKGIRYADQGSRGKEGGTSNYVVFDDKTVQILKKYGLAGLTTAGAGAAVAGQGLKDTTGKSIPAGTQIY